MMQERRRHKRFRIDDMEIAGKMMFAKEVKIIDMSAGGISLNTDRRLNIGREYSLRIKDKDKEMILKGTVTWALLSEIKKDEFNKPFPVYTAGMRFIDFSDSKTNEIINFVDKHKRDDEYRKRDSRYYVRFDIDASISTVLNFHEQYKVKALSLSGMLIDSYDALEPENIFQMEIFLSDDKSINFLGKVTSCHLISNEPVQKYDIGIEFIDMSEEDRGKIEEFTHKLETFNKGRIISDKTLENLKKVQIDYKTEAERVDSERTTDVIEADESELKSFYLFTLEEQQKKLKAAESYSKILQDKSTNLDAEVQRLKREKSQLETEREELRDHLEQYEEIIGADRANIIKEKEILETKISEMEKRVQFSEKSLSEVTQDRDKLRFLLQDEQVKIHELKMKEEEQRKQYHEAENSIEQIGEEKERLIAEIEKLKSERIQIELERDTLKEEVKHHEEKAETERIDSEKTREALESKLTDAERKLEFPESDLHQDNKEISSKDTKKSMRPRILFIAILSLLLLFVVFLYLIFSPSVSKKQNTIHQPILSKQESEKESLPEVIPKDLHTIELIAEDTTWILITIDDLESKETILHPGDRLKMNAKNNFSLKIGNAGGIKIIFNGKDIGSIGDKDQVVRLKLPSS